VMLLGTPHGTADAVTRFHHVWAYCVLAAVLCGLSGSLIPRPGWRTAVAGYNPDMAEKKGKVKETLGWATGDRRTEAAGRVEAKGGDPRNEREVAHEQKKVRRDEGDVRKVAR